MNFHLNTYFLSALVVNLGLSNQKYFLIELDGEEETDASLRLNSGGKTIMYSKI